MIIPLDGSVRIDEKCMPGYEHTRGRWRHRTQKTRRRVDCDFTTVKGMDGFLRTRLTEACRASGVELED